MPRSGQDSSVLTGCQELDLSQNAFWGKLAASKLYVGVGLLILVRIGGSKAGSHSGPWTPAEVSVILLIAGLIVAFLAVIFFWSYKRR